jgi:hypothetical protein
MYDCNRLVEISKLTSSDELVCYKVKLIRQILLAQHIIVFPRHQGLIPLLGGRKRKDAILLALTMPLFPFQFLRPYYSFIEDYKKAVGLGPNQSYTVVHWRRYVVDFC